MAYKYDKDKGTKIKKFAICNFTIKILVIPWIKCILC